MPERAVKIFTVLKLEFKKLRNHSTHTTTLQQLSCTQTHVHFTTLAHYC